MTRHARPILPGATIGILGSGQLGRMLALAAREMGYRVAIYSPESDTPAGQVADREVVGAYHDEAAVRGFAAGVDVVTFEFENVSVQAAESAARVAPVRPDGSVLHTTQHRAREKTFLRAAGIPCAPFKVIERAEDLAAAVAEIGTPAILKTAGWGYDGKGQARIAAPADADGAWRAIGGGPAVLEAFIDFVAELSVVVARDLSGAVAAYPPILNRHANHILDVSVVPAPFDPKIQQAAVHVARSIADALGAVGVLCVEFFLARDGRLLVNEVAPRVHNSGHLTIEAAVTSQFEQHVRAICGLPLGDPRLLTPAAMTNLLGDLWAKGDLDWRAALEVPATHLHLYGKAEPRPGRKMGHLTALAGRPDEAAKRALMARAALTGEKLPPLPVPAAPAPESAAPGATAAAAPGLAQHAD